MPDSRRIPPPARPAIDHRLLSILLVGAVALLSARPARAAEAASPPPTPTPTPEQLEFFEKHVRPVFVEHCHACHSRDAAKLKGDLFLDNRAGWLRGGASGKPALVPGAPDDSLLVKAIRHADPELAMPPKQKLPEAAIDALVQWVAMGAPDPRLGGSQLPNPKDLARTHWAFQPIRKPAPPSVPPSDWIASPIDAFILAGLRDAGLAPAPRADRRTLLRRASQLLTGLPPTFQECADFASDASPEAWARVVDRLLASPRYGERWARYWLDIARYADTKGYVFEEERRYPYAYTYRDYVVRAFNDDKPYDRFLVEQIAGDHVATPADPAPLAALGFLTLGRRFLNNPHDIIDDRIDVLTRGTLGLTVTCARCHDHKYDYVPSADYYSLYGVLASSHEPAEKPLLGASPDPVQHAAFEQELARRARERDDFIRDKEAEYRRKLRTTLGDQLLAAHLAAQAEDSKREEIARGRQLSPVVVRRWISALEDHRRKPEPLFAAWLSFADLPSDRFAEAARTNAAAIAANAAALHHPRLAAAFAGEPPTTLEEVAQRYNAAFTDPADEALAAFLAAPGTPIALTTEELYRLFNVPDAQRRRALQRAYEELQATHPGAPPRAMSLADNATPTDPVVFKRGNPANRGAQVPRRFLEILSGPDRKPFTQGSGRLELARAIASPDNPLTARVAVNRVWQQLFGSGLVRTPSDFGLRSDPPTHPELLDWLAATFLENGWSTKKLLREILLSSAWQQSSATSPEAEIRDPENRLLSRQSRRRLEFEATRDLLLLASGQLDLAMGGHSVEITTRDYAPRRTVYGYVERQNLPGLFRTFDFASPDVTSAQRFQTTVPQQALFFLNSPFALDQARRFANRPDVLALAGHPARVERLYALLLQRPPTSRELQLAEHFLAGSDPSDSAPQPALPIWSHGTGLLDFHAQAVRRFEPLPHFTGSAWQGGSKLPDPKLGWNLLDAEGGHPGGPSHGPVIRRWTAPVEGVVQVSGSLKHPAAAGDGVRATLVSSRHGFLGQWTVRKSSSATDVPRVRVLRGDTLDFVVDCLADENSDGFRWAPKVELIDPLPPGVAPPSWDARTDFGGPGAAVHPLNRWERYAHVLLMSNEAVFID